MKRTAIRFVSSLTILLPLAAGLAGRAQAGPLNPLDFTSLGAFPTASGTYTFNSSGTPTLIGPGGTVVETGALYNGIAVFDFDSINVSSGQIFEGGSGPAPLALLSRSGATIAGFIDVSAPGYSSGPSSLGGPGSVDLGAGSTGGAAGRDYGGGGGGGFGGPGGAGGDNGSAAGGSGGPSYGNPAIQLQGGSAGGGAGPFPSNTFGGGGGGGAIEISAVGGMTISGNIYANGAQGPSDSGWGGGSGGAIFLNAPSVELSGLLLAAGGQGSPYFSAGGPGGYSIGPGGGGSGGYVTIFGRYTLITGSGPNGIDVSGGFAGQEGTGAADGANGIVAFSVPEPASLVLMGTGMLALLGIHRRHRRVAA